MVDTKIPVEMDEEVLRSISNIIDYLYRDELQHWMEAEQTDRHGHIFLDVQRLVNWFDKQN